MKMDTLVRALAALAVAQLGACAAPPASTAGGVSNDVVRCSTRVIPDALVGGAVSKPGLSNLLTFELSALSPDPPAVGTNKWMLTLRKSDGTAVPQASITKIVPFMPDHGHGSSVTPQAAASGDGFALTDLYLFMPGLWQVTISATTADNVTDSAIFAFCVGS